MICDPYVKEREHIYSIMLDNRITAGPEELYTYLMGQPRSTVADCDGHNMLNMAASIKRKMVWLNDINCEYAYFGALHEIGHILNPKAVAAHEDMGFWVTDEMSVPMLNCEAHAWEWALVNSLHDPDDDTARNIEDCMCSYLDTYYNWYVSKNMGKLHPLFRTYLQEGKWKVKI